jgi:hypothetical protein
MIIFFGLFVFIFMLSGLIIIAACVAAFPILIVPAVLGLWWFYRQLRKLYRWITNADTKEAIARMPNALDD